MSVVDLWSLTFLSRKHPLLHRKPHHFSSFTRLSLYTFMWFCCKTIYILQLYQWCVFDKVFYKTPPALLKISPLFTLFSTLFIHLYVVLLQKNLYFTALSMVDLDRVFIKTLIPVENLTSFHSFPNFRLTPLCGESASDRIRPLPADKKSFKSRVPAFYKSWRVLFRHFCSSFIQHQFYI